MDFLIDLLNRKEIWTLIGVALGFSLTESTRIIRQAIVNRMLRKALIDELETNYFQLEHKKDTIKNIVSALEKKRLLPASSVSSATAVYDTSLAKIITLLKPIERDVIQNVYGRLFILDKFFTEFEDRFKASLSDEVTTDPWTAYKSMLVEHSDSCGVAQELIRSVLDKKPVDIYGRKKKTSVQEGVFGGVVTPEIVRKQRGA